MNTLNEVFDALYSRFFMRDILSKVIPGFLTLVFFLYHLNPQVIEYVINEGTLLQYVLIYGISFALGMMLQWIGEILKIININVWPKRRFLQPADNPGSLKKLHIFLDRTKSRPDIRASRERVAIMKHITGTYAIGLLLIMVGSVLIYYPGGISTETWILLGIGLSVSILLISQNWHHANEQRTWEGFYINKNRAKKKSR